MKQLTLPGSGMTLGHHLLQEKLKIYSQSTLAGLIQMQPSRMSQLSRVFVTPTRAQKLRIQRILGIPCSSWETVI